MLCHGSGVVLDCIFAFLTFKLIIKKHQFKKCVLQIVCTCMHINYLISIFSTLQDERLDALYLIFKS